MTLDKKHTAFYTMCQNNFRQIIKKSKRMAPSPAPNAKRAVNKMTPPSVKRLTLTKIPSPMRPKLQNERTEFRRKKRFPGTSSQNTSVQNEIEDFALLDELNIGQEIDVYESTQEDQAMMSEKRTADQDYLDMSHLSKHNENEEELKCKEAKSEKENQTHDHGYYDSSIKTNCAKDIKPKLKEKMLKQPMHHDYLFSDTKPSKFDSLYKEMREHLQGYNYICDENTQSDYSQLSAAIYTNKLRIITDAILCNEQLRNSIIVKLATENEHEAKMMYASERGRANSVLLQKSSSDLKKFSWSSILDEFKRKFPILFYQILSLMVKNENQRLNAAMESAVPKLGLIYGIMMQERNNQFSLVQRVNSCIFMDSICDVNVYDKLNKEGVCLSYLASLNFADVVAGTFNEALIDVIRNKKRFRLVGDNINWKVGVHDQRLDNRSKMMHAFGSAILVQNVDFSHCSNSQQMDYRELQTQAFLPSIDDYDIYKFDYTVLMSRVVVKFLPFFQQFEEIVPTKINKQVNEKMSDRTKVIPMPVLFKNEQKYQDVIEIMDYYEKMICEAHVSAGVPLENVKIHIGGDQLTRERFSGAKCLRGHEDSSTARLDHLSPISFELFHMHMNYLQMAYNVLYDQKSGHDLGSMKSLQNIISRTKVMPEVHTHYDADRDFFISVVDVHIVDLFMEYFGMEDRNASPSKNVPPVFECVEDKREWYFATVGKMIEEFVFQHNEENVADGKEVLFELQLPGGKKLVVRRKERAKESPDGVMDYANRILEMGLLFKDLLDVTRMPERIRHLSLLKLAMLHFKSHRNLSKYAYEILRLLVHQMCLLSERSANEEYYGLFVNTNGHADGHIPADLRMEYLVKTVKTHIKHMYLNKTEKNIVNRTSSISVLAEITERFDDVSNVTKRTSKHSDKSAMGDEYCLLDTIREVRPYIRTPGRSHTNFRNILPSAIIGLDIEHCHQWIDRKKSEFAVEIGN